jgi:hypothetical protein
LREADNILRLHHNRFAIGRRNSRREMKLLKGMGITLCLVVICVLVAPKAKANEQSNQTVVTFAVPVEVPGVSAQTLPAGTYLFKALESSPDRDIIQVSSPDGSQVFATMLGVPNSRLKAPDLVTVMFTDRPAADPQALEAWYCPGRMWGDQIVYEKSRAIELAKETNGAVLSTSVVLASSSVEVLKTAVIEAVSPTGETIAMAQVVDSPPVAAPAVAATAVPAVAPAPVTTDASTVAVASSPAPEPIVATQTTVAAGPALAVVPATAPASTVAYEPAVGATPSSAIVPPATSATAPVGEPAATPAPAVASEPVATAAPTVPAEPAVTSSNEVATATLPKTASLLSLVGLGGLLLLGAGCLLTSLMKRRA